jgi:hypothetical protein
MKKLAVLALATALSFAANAIPIEVPGMGQDIPKNGTGKNGANGDNEPNNFFRLQTVISAYNAAHPGSPLPTPIETGFLIPNNQSNDTFANGGLSGFDYAVIHYGAGSGGTHGSGGGVEVFFLNGASSFTFPANGTGQNGFGGFSSITLFDALPVPEGGTTVLLLGAALSAFGLLRRKLG